ncbi:hypothetical protein KDK77_08835 [bacterium]|nr:hypothetical protein [bacterium]
MKRHTLFFLFFSLLLITAENIYAQIELVTDNYFYPKTALPGSTITFSARIRNIGSTGVFVYGGVLLTNQKTNVTSELYPPPGTFTLPAGGRTQITLAITLKDATSGLNLEDGSYTVAMLIFNAFTDVRIHTIFGGFPLLIGTPGQGLNIHPSRITFGTLRYGRFMYPIPIKIRYKMFLPNQLSDIQPWAMRIYTENAHKFTGIPGSIRQLSPSGLVHSSGKYAIPIKFWNLNWGPDAHTTGWEAGLEGPPPVEDDMYWKGVFTDESTDAKFFFDLKPWLSIPDFEDMTVEPDTWKRMVGVFTYDGQFVNPENKTGDYQLSTPPDHFDVYLAVEIGSTAVHGKYSGRLIVEIISP